MGEDEDEDEDEVTTTTITMLLTVPGLLKPPPESLHSPLLLQ